MFFGSEVRRGGEIETRPALYSMQDLGSWYEKISTAKGADQVLNIPGVVARDLDEGANRITIWATDDSANSIVRGTVDKLGIPADAVNVEHQAEPHFAARSNLANSCDLQGGLEIDNGDGACSLGFVSKRTVSSTTQLGLITASHCSDTLWTLDNSEFEQPSGGSVVADETYDLDYFWTADVPSCPTSRKCRWSDAQFSVIRNGVSYDRGFIANADVGDDDIDSGQPQWRVSREDEGSQNDTVRKVGQVTGTSVGQISKTCVDADFQDSGIGLVTVLCQNKVDADHLDGDSGAPVFEVTDFPQTDDVDLAGILIGGQELDYYYYSPIGAIYMEIDQDAGSWATWSSCAPSLSC